MTYFLTIACIIGGWAMLRIIGSERTALLTELESRLKREAPPSPPAAAEKSPSPTPSPDAKIASPAKP